MFVQIVKIPPFSFYRIYPQFEMLKITGKGQNEILRKIKIWEKLEKFGINFEVNRRTEFQIKDRWSSEMLLLILNNVADNIVNVELRFHEKLSLKSPRRARNVKSRFEKCRF